jgi:hypothetical protein
MPFEEVTEVLKVEQLFSSTIHLEASNYDELGKVVSTSNEATKSDDEKPWIKARRPSKKPPVTVVTFRADPNPFELLVAEAAEAGCL